MHRDVTHVTYPASRRDAKNDSALCSFNSPTARPSRSSQLLSRASWHTRLRTDHLAYPRAANHSSYPAAHGANGPRTLHHDTSPTPIAASRRIEETENGKRQSAADDYVQPTALKIRISAGETHTGTPSLTIIGRSA
jgi:hypothetical protein